MQMDTWRNTWRKRCFDSQKQTGKFHPIWIVLAAIATLIVAGIIWLPALIVPRVEPKPQHSPSLSPPIRKVMLATQGYTERLNSFTHLAVI